MRKGFTLIELLVVISILGILAALLLVTINPAVQIEKANDAHRKTDLESVQRALELYYNDNSKYPVSLNWGTAWAPYMSMLPKDPVSSYTYVYFSTGQAYYLYAHLQRGKNDQQVCNSGLACAGFSQGIVNFPSSNACGAVCNYGISSPNVSP